MGARASTRIESTAAPVASPRRNAIAIAQAAQIATSSTAERWKRAISTSSLNCAHHRAPSSTRSSGASPRADGSASVSAGPNALDSVNWLTRRRRECRRTRGARNAMRPSPIRNAAARLVATSAGVGVQEDFALGRAGAGAWGVGGGGSEVGGGELLDGDREGVVDVGAVAYGWSVRERARDRARVVGKRQRNRCLAVEGDDPELLQAGALGGERARGGHRLGERCTLHA